MNSSTHTSRTPHSAPANTSPRKAIAIMAGCLAALLFVVYVGVAVYFTGRFMPSSTAGSVDLSLMTKADAEQALSEATQDYTLTISGQGFDLELTATDMGLDADESTIVDGMLADMNPWLWPLQIGARHNESAKLAEGTATASLADVVNAAVADFNASATPPSNAVISYNAAICTFSISPESVGTALDANAVLDAARQALATLSTHATITIDALQQPTVFSTDERLKTALDSANTMVAANITLTMAGVNVGTLDSNTIAPWVTSDENANAVLDETQLSAWIDQIDTACTTVGSTRDYTRPDGKAITVSGGVYGWEVDRDALAASVREAISAGNTQTIEVPTVTHGDAYTAAGAQDWGERYLDIDLAEQHARLYDDSGALVWESDIVSGIPDGEHDTPTGVYWMNKKESPSTLKGYSGDAQIYDTVVQYWMPFVGGAIGLHDADWQDAFGGTRYSDGYGSHGCVNLPVDKAAELYDLVDGGDVVVCHW